MYVCALYLKQVRFFSVFQEPVFAFLGQCFCPPPPDPLSPREDVCVGAVIPGDLSSFVSCPHLCVLLSVKMTELLGVPVGLSHLVHGAHTQKGWSWAEKGAPTIRGCICWAGPMAGQSLQGVIPTYPCPVSQPEKSTQTSA